MHDSFEAVDVGETRSFGAYEVTAAEIVAFAERWDPQPFHTDPEAARESMFGELVASGWHTAAITMRLLVDNYVNDSGAIGARGLEELRWLQPVRPGDTLSVQVEIADKTPLDEARGEVTPLVETLNAEGDVVQRMRVSVLYRRRA